MLKRNFGKSHCEGEPPAKQPNFESQLVNNSSYLSQNENNFKIPPPNDQIPKKPSVLIGILEKKPIDKSQFFDNVLEYFDKKPGADSGGSNKQNIGVMKPNIIDSDAADPPRPIKSNRPNHKEAQLPQMLMNPKARFNTPSILKNPTGIPILVQKLRCYSGPKAKQRLRNLAPSNGNNSPFMRKRAKTFSQMRQPECCIIEKLIKRFQNLKVEPLSGNELSLFIKNGRPTPPIPSLGVRVTLYDHHLWITGCPTLGGLYCWLCLLFSRTLLKTQNSVWVREGFRTMNILGTAMTKHLSSAAHREAVSIKDTMIRNRVIPNFMLQANLGHSSNDTKAGLSVPALKPFSTTSNAQSTDQNKASLPPSKPVPSKTNSPSMDVQNQASHSLPATEAVSVTSSKQSINIQNLPHEDVVKPASFESRKISSNENHVLTSQLDSSTGKLNECDTDVVPTADESGENLGPQPQTPQPKINDLTNSGNCERSSPQTEELSRPNDSPKKNLAQCTQAQYLKLRKEQEKRELITQPSMNNKKQPPGNPSPAHPANTIKLPSFGVVDLTILQARFFPSGSFNGSEKLRELIINTGRPTPEMPGLSQEVNGVMKHFSKSDYCKFPWICGSAEMNRLFCWPCFMFKDHEHNSFWNTVGYNNMANLSSLAKSHSISQSHLELSIRLKMVESSTKNKYQKSKIDPAKHNETVRQKRSLMKHLIDAVCFKKKQLNNAEICHDDFNDFLKILSNYDIKLKTLLDPESPNYIADFTPNFISNYSHEITKALKGILQQKIAEEVEYSVYVSFILKTVKNKRVALILRYTKSTGEVHERFYKFFKIGFGLQEDLLKEIVAEVYELKCSAKFVGISYDGGLLRPNQMESFNSNLRNELMAAHFFHYRDESFQALLQQSLSHTPFGRSFFQLVTEFGNFLQDNPRVKNFVRRLECEMSRENLKDWDLKSGIIITIRDHYLGIMKFLDQVVNRSLSPNTWTNRVVSQCSKFSLFLGLAESRLFLVLFSKVYVALRPVIEAFHGAFDAEYWKSATSEAYNVIMDIKICSFRGISYEADELVGLNVKGLPFTDKARLSTMFNDAVDWILAFIKYRTKYIDIWSYYDFSTKKIDSPFAKAQEHQAEFQMDLTERFPFFDSQKLGSALIFAHNNARFRNKSAGETIQVMNEFDFKSVLPELYSFLLLIQTVPQSSANVSRPASEKITAYVQGKTHLKSANALLHLEKDLLSSIRNEETFYNDVLKIVSELKPTNEFTKIDQFGKLVEQ